MRLILALASIGALAAAPAFAQQGAADARYDRCLDLTETQAEAALNEAFAWADQGGGARARHCIAIAYLRLGDEEEAAARLEALAGDPLFAAQAPRAELLRQAAASWLVAGDLARARDAATRALTVSPSADLHVLRAQALMEAQDYRAAEMDLDEALALDAAHAQALTLRAVARMARGDLAAAQADAEAAIEADRASVDARLVLGDIREAQRGARPRDEPIDEARADAPFTITGAED